MRFSFKLIAGQAAAMCVMAGFIVFTPAANAFQPLITDDTGTQGEGGNQLEFSLSRDRTSRDGGTEPVDTAAAAYTRGLSETVDVFIGQGFSRIHAIDTAADVSGYGNPSIGVKWRFYENQESKTSLAIKPEIIFPVSSGRESSGLGSGKTSGNLTLILSQEMPFGAVHFNAGVGRERFRDTGENPHASYRRVSVAPVWDVNERWKLAVDLGLEFARAEGHTARSKFIELGAIYAPNNDVDLAFGIVRSSDNENPKSTTDSVTAGVTWRF